MLGSVAEAEEADRAYYASLTPQQRLDLQLDLIARYRESLGEVARGLDRALRSVASALPSATMTTIPQRELRNRSGEILRQAEAGQEFLITVGGRPVARLGPWQKQPWVSKARLQQILRDQGPDPTFFADLSQHQP